jgi:hypothetical protein
MGKQGDDEEQLNRVAPMRRFDCHCGGSVR